MSRGYKWGFRQGGLMRCCVETLHKHDTPGSFDGQTINCLYCSSKMRWVDQDRAWEWDRNGEFSGQQAITGVLTDVNQSSGGTEKG